MKFGDVELTTAARGVALVEIQRGPSNFFDRALVANLADAVEALNADSSFRTAVLTAEGKHFCAGAKLVERDAPSDDKELRNRPNQSAKLSIQVSEAENLYREMIRLYKNRKYLIAAIQGATVGGGFAISLVADFRIASANTRFVPNFVKLGFTPGLGVTLRLPQLIGIQAASEILSTGKNVGGERAHAMGLVDELVADSEIRESAIELARDIASNAPLALRSLREQLRGDWLDRLQPTMQVEMNEQRRLMGTEDFQEGVRAVAERRPGRFKER